MNEYTFYKRGKETVSKWNFLTSFKNGNSSGKYVIIVEARMEREKKQQENNLIKIMVVIWK